jgi:hypothetical protein
MCLFYSVIYINRIKIYLINMNNLCVLCNKWPSDKCNNCDNINSCWSCRAFNKHKCEINKIDVEIKKLNDINNYIENLKNENTNLKLINNNLNKQIEIFQKRIEFQTIELNRILLLNTNNISNLTIQTNETNNTNNTNETNNTNNTNETNETRENNLLDLNDNTNEKSISEIPTIHNEIDEPPKSPSYNNNISNLERAKETIDQAQNIIDEIKQEAILKKNKIKQRITNRKTATLTRLKTPLTSRN